MPKERRHHCNACKTTFSATVRTVFHHTHVPLQKWFLAIALVLGAKNEPSSRQLARDLAVNRNTGWRIAMQIREAMTQREQRALLLSMAEMHETFLDNKMRRDQEKAPMKPSRSTKQETIVNVVGRDSRTRPRA